MRLPSIDQNIPIQERVATEQAMMDMLNANKALLQIRVEKADDRFGLFPSRGTGFYLGEQIITAFHVISGNIKSIQGNGCFPLEIKKMVQTIDLVVLGFKKPLDVFSFEETLGDSTIRVVSAKSTFRFLKKKKTLSLRDVIVGIKCMHGPEPLIFLGELSKLDTREGEIEIIFTSSDLNGCSGGPVFLWNGDVIGIIVTKSNVLGYAVAIGDLGISSAWVENVP